MNNSYCNLYTWSFQKRDRICSCDWSSRDILEAKSSGYPVGKTSYRIHRKRPPGCVSAIRGRSPLSGSQFYSERPSRKRCPFYWLKRNAVLPEVSNRFEIYSLFYFISNTNIVQFSPFYLFWMGWILPYGRYMSDSLWNDIVQLNTLSNIVGYLSISPNPSLSLGASWVNQMTRWWNGRS